MSVGPEYVVLGSIRLVWSLGLESVALGYVGGKGGEIEVERRAPYREIDFGFVFVRAVRAGEAKLRGRARGKSPVAEARPDQMSPFRRTVARGVPPVSRCR